MDETTQNPGETEAKALTDRPEANLEHVLDAWSAEPSARPRYDRLRFERRDGESLEVLIDSETARDLGDKLTITAARARHRTRGASGVPENKSVDPGDAEDLARAIKVCDLMGLPEPYDASYKPLVEEFRASRLDVAKAHAMLDEQRAKHVADMAAIAQRHVDASGELEIARKQERQWLDNAVERNNRITALEAELESVKADRANLIAEAAERDIEVGDGVGFSATLRCCGFLCAHERKVHVMAGNVHGTKIGACPKCSYPACTVVALGPPTIDLSDPSEPAPP